jgi:6-phosphofructokinase 1
MDTVKKLSEYTKKNNIDIKVVGVPKTIDNDLNGIDHSPGFGSAAKYIAYCVRSVAYDTSIYNIKSVHIIETMGRDAGWLTASSVLARQEDIVAPHLIYLPEVPFCIDRFVDDVKIKLKEYNSVIVVVSEGIRDENGEYICAQNAKKDNFGHSQLSGTGAFLKSVVEEKIGCKVRALEPGVLQRSAGHMASLTDIEEAFNLGMMAVSVAVQGKTGVFSTIERLSDNPYCIKYSTQNIDVIANTEKKVPRNWINEAGNDVTSEMVDYLKPLIEGVVQIPYRNGLPDYIDIRHLDIKQQKYQDKM